jgi:enoyl-CoA hydratase/carnithine racemase
MEVRLTRHSRHVAIVTVDNQPRLNAMTRKMLSDLGRLWDELERDRDCRCIILTGARERAFTVGADVSGDLSAGPEVARMGQPCSFEERRLFEADRRRGERRLR